MIKTANTISKHFHYGLSGELLAENQDDGTVTREYTYLHGQMISVIDTLPPTTEAAQTAIKTKPALEKTNTQLEADNRTNTSTKSGGGFEFIVF